MTDGSAEFSAIIDVVNRVALLADLRAWDDLASCFADTVEVDYRSFGEEVKHLAPAELIREWSWLNELSVTQHDVTSHIVEVDGDHARCRAHVRATHFADGGLGDNMWSCWGNYDYRLRRTADGWKVERTEFTLRSWRGNPEINERAHLAVTGRRSTH
jgi:hypothetical protein